MSCKKTIPFNDDGIEFDYIFNLHNNRVMNRSAIEGYILAVCVLTDQCFLCLIRAGFIKPESCLILCVFTPIVLWVHSNSWADINKQIAASCV